MSDFNPNLQVLLTDDDADDLMLFEEAIKEISLSIKLAFVVNGKDLLKLLESDYNPSLIFLDLNMPGKSGKDCLKEIKSHPLHHNIPVIMYSTSNNKNDIESCYKQGADLYVVKPYLFTDIVKMLEKVFALDFSTPKTRSKDDFVLS